MKIKVLAILTLRVNFFIHQVITAAGLCNSQAG